MPITPFPSRHPVRAMPLPACCLWPWCRALGLPSRDIYSGGYVKYTTGEYAHAQCHDFEHERIARLRTGRSDGYQNPDLFWPKRGGL